jgi:hypothetical protein
LKVENLVEKQKPQKPSAAFWSSPMPLCGKKSHRSDRYLTKTGKTPSDVCDSCRVFVLSAMALSLRTSS